MSGIVFLLLNLSRALGYLCVRVYTQLLYSKPGFSLSLNLVALRSLYNISMAWVFSFGWRSAQVHIRRKERPLVHVQSSTRLFTDPCPPLPSHWKCFGLSSLKEGWNRPSDVILRCWNTNWKNDKVISMHRKGHNFCSRGSNSAYPIAFKTWVNLTLSLGQASQG